MNIDYKQIGNRIKQERMKLNISQMSLADKADLSVPYISYIETGKKKISLRALLAISVALNTTPDALLIDILTVNKDTSGNQVEKLFSDCTQSEIVFISDIIRAVKYCIRSHKWNL